ncbi:hypothetical protein [Rhodococcus sp. BP22]|uniref:hypothetical protein n=1 Tax=Rhodococcus sp. BP22 TaxID=2758566 RepID=UPI00164541D8|nr:hypothetical protein [Rhodococcus sp. BP22]
MMLAIIMALLATLGQSPTTLLDHIPDTPAAVRTFLGDDNADSFIDEDESGWSCSIDGNQHCGPPR